MFVKPGPDRMVRDPRTKRHIPDDGIDVPEDQFWLTALRHGDVVIAERPEPAADVEQIERPAELHEAEIAPDAHEGDHA